MCDCPKTELLWLSYIVELRIVSAIAASGYPPLVVFFEGLVVEAGAFSIVK